MAAAAETLGGGGEGLARLYLDDVGTKVLTHIKSRGSGSMTVEQALPFLRLESGVRDEEGRTGRIRDVRMALRDGLPRLVLDLVYDEPTREPPTARIGVDDTLPAFVVAEGAPIRRRDSTMRWGAYVEPEEKVDVEEKTPRRHDPTAPWFGGPLCPPGQVTVEATTPEREDRDSVVVFSKAAADVHGEITAIVTRDHGLMETARPATPWVRWAGALLQVAATRAKAAARRILIALLGMEGRQKARPARATSSRGS